MKLIEGKFFENGIEIKPEFGNKEQIALIQSHERLAIELKNGLVVDPEFTVVTNASLRFNCLCGKEIYSSLRDLDEFETDEAFIGQREKCSKCNRKYEFSKSEDGDLIVKLL
jgi:redox-regulated HSP33 family molecular chaperone